MVHNPYKREKKINKEGDFLVKGGQKVRPVVLMFDNLSALIFLWVEE